MLTISKALNASQAGTYHTKDFVSETQSYYAKDDAFLGEWQGELADRLGLSGTVSKADFMALAKGQNPQTGEQMVKHRHAQEQTNPNGSITKAVEHRAGWDATFSAPKSVSLTALVGGDELVRLAHREAVTAALSELEKYTQARIGGNNPAEQTGRFVAAKFEHDTARPVDGYAAPQLHTHAVIFNVTEREDGSTRALQERAFFESQSYGTAVYQSHLTYKLRELGYELERGRSGAPEVKGFSQEYLDASSPRSEKIREHLERNGIKGPEAAEIAAHATREKKQDLTKEQVLQAHREVAAEFGNEASRVVAEARQRSIEQGVRQPSPVRAQEAMTFARDHLFEREAVADERAIMTAALRRRMGEATFSEVRDQFSARREQGQFQTVAQRTYDSAQRYTTPDTLDAERSNIQQVRDGRHALAPMMTEREAFAQAETRSFLNDAQRRVVHEVLTSTDRVHGLQGLAGSGKTASLETIREGAEAKGYKVEGFAPTSRAAAQLREAGIEANTLQSFLARKTGTQPASRHLYMLDEASLASSKQMRDFLRKVSPDDRVLVIGDIRQHQGVEAGKPFEQMQQAGMQTSQLDQIMRQKDAELLKAVQHLATGETEKGVELLAQQGRVTEVRNGADRIAAIAKDYAAQPENTLVVSPDNRSRQQINEAIRAELQSAGQLSPESREFQTLAHRSDLTGAGRTWSALYNPGDVIRYESGSHALGFERNSQARVIGVDARTNTLTVQKQDGEQISYNPKRLYGVNVFEERGRDFSLGERIQFTSGNRDLDVANRDLGTITALEERSITIRMDGKSGREVTFDPTEFRQLDHGYAVTSHSSQGLTADRMIANIDTDSSRSLINDRLAYVALSRAAYDARIYTNDAGTLGQRLATEVSKTAALDLSDVRQAVDSFRRDDPQSATALLRDTNRIHIYSDPEHRFSAVAQDYVSKEDRAVILAPDKAEREELTRLIRVDLHGQGRLGEISRATVLSDKMLSDKDAKIAANYEVGDVIRYGSKGSDELGISPNTYGTVTGVNAEKNLITVTGTDDSPRTYNPATEWQMRLKATVYSREERELAEGERIQLTRSEWDQGIRVGNLATIEHIHEDGGLSVKVDSGASLQLTPEQAQHVEYGYAIESTKRLAVDRVILSGEAEQITAQRHALSQLPAKLHELIVYTSDGYQTAAPELVVQKEVAGPALTEIPTPEINVPSIEFEGYAIEF
ncbi:conjugative relaxase-like TrwC/TraI family protein [Granulicella aggregans]|uniref:Conjugative relaxase-like TrwC/TraI family protein n=1 Tax=Granulicella aggregans TaxID=474949 RepID=A0A7W7ZJI0_9BACT|nr:MobF family relaxase [Granulicella aggregans]MBB5061072.1 conjugative relaxase-like TrwC/TraI family protein [Granulicella aggregans]